jgi:hypothetical protein
MKKKVTVRDCAGCRDDFYNHNRMGLNESEGVPRCWSLDTAQMAKARDVPIDLRPPYKHIPLTIRPDCYKRNREIRVPPERLDAKGFWK